jgi:hypothetical protein
MIRRLSGAARDRGVVSCWGRNRHGQIGDRSNTDRQNPMDVIGLLW